MKLRLLYILSITATLLSSCIKEEPLNKECDIRKAVIHLPKPEDYFELLEDTAVCIMDSYSDSLITFKGVKPTAYLNGITPTFTISAGAELFPRQGTRLDFSDGKIQKYYVIAEDTKSRFPIPTSTQDYPAFTQQLIAAINAGEHIRQYEVQFSTNSIENEDTIFYDFENYYLETKGHKYYEWSDLLNGRPRTTPNWATANMGFSTARSTARPEEYPTVPIAKGGVDNGAFVKLETKSTGEFGKSYNMPLAAGNLFLGTFDFSKVLISALQATRFGDNNILGRKPAKFMGYYKYYPGNQMTGPDGKDIEGTDEPDIYCVVYKNHDSKGKSVVLNGETINKNTYVIGKAIITKWKYSTEEWVPFELGFDWYEPLDEQTLENNGYNFAIVCSSSKEGATYTGATGSTLYVDKFMLIFE